MDVYSKCLDNAHASGIDALIGPGCIGARIGISRMAIRRALAVRLPWARCVTYGAIIALQPLTGGLKVLDDSTTPSHPSSCLLSFWPI